MNALMALIHVPRPDGRWQDTAEGGSAVVAYWPRHDGISAVASTRQIATGVIPVNSDWAQVGQVFPDYICLYQGPVDPARFDDYVASVPLAGRLVLGAGPALYCDGHGYWTATRDDLTVAGREVIAALDRAYATPAILVTHIDT